MCRLKQEDESGSNITDLKMQRWLIGSDELVARSSFRRTHIR
jgi:hypothetical protein